MGETKKIDIPALAEACARFYPALKAAAALDENYITEVLSESGSVSFGDIKKEAHCSVSGTCNFLTEAVKTGVVEKDPTKPLYRLNSYNSIREKARLFIDKKIQPVNLKTGERLVFSFIRNAVVFEALQGGELCLGDIQKKIGLAQSPASLKMSRLHEYGWVNKRRDGKNVYYSLSDYTRRFLVDLAGAGL